MKRIIRYFTLRKRIKESYEATQKHIARFTGLKLDARRQHNYSGIDWCNSKIEEQIEIAKVLTNLL